METIQARGRSRRLGDASVAPWQPRTTPSPRRCARWTEHVRTLLVVLDQFEDYFLYHPDEDGDGHVRRRASARSSTSQTCACTSCSRSARTRSAKLDRFKGQHPAPLRELRARRAPDRAAPRGRRSRGRFASGTGVSPPETSRTRSSPRSSTRSSTRRPRASSPRSLGTAHERTSRADRQHVEAPFLQLVLERLWRATVAGGSRDLTLAGLEALGGAAADRREPPARGAGRAHVATSRRSRRDVFRYLVTRSKTKIAHPASDLADWTSRPEAEVTEVLDKLCRGESGRILRRVPPPADG